MLLKERTECGLTDTVRISTVVNDLFTTQDENFSYKLFADADTATLPGLEYEGLAGSSVSESMTLQ
jgi:hypothetical protein